MHTGSIDAFQRIYLPGPHTSGLWLQENILYICIKNILGNRENSLKNSFLYIQLKNFPGSDVSWKPWKPQKDCHNQTSTDWFLLTYAVVTHTAVWCSRRSKYLAGKTKFKFNSLSIYWDLLHSGRRPICLRILIWSFWKKKRQAKLCQAGFNEIRSKIGKNDLKFSQYVHTFVHPIKQACLFPEVFLVDLLRSFLWTL